MLGWTCVNVSAAEGPKWTMRGTWAWIPAETGVGRAGEEDGAGRLLVYFMWHALRVSNLWLEG